MFARMLLRSIALRRAAAPPRAIPRAFPLPHPRLPSPTLQRFASNQPWANSRPTIQSSIPLAPKPSPVISRSQSNHPWGRFPDRPPRRRHTRWDPNEIKRARPLITTERIAYIFRHRFTHFVLLAAAGGGVVFYFSNIEEVPVSGRRRFNCFSEETVEAEGATYYKMIMEDARQQGTLVPDWDSRTKMVKRVMKNLIPASGVEANWEINVLESKETNAFVLPGGKVFVYTGILPIAKNDDGLAAILGHEIAHNVARHSAESMSRDIIITWPLRIIAIALDATGSTGGVLRILFDLVIGPYGITKPASRKQESEADYIGLMIMAKSCYDPRAAVEVWERFQAAEGEHIPEWSSTHPSNNNRIKQMTEWLPAAEDARNESACAVTLGYSDAFNKALEDSGNIWGIFR